MTVEAKGHRIYVDGRCRVVKNTSTESWNVVEGDSGEYVVILLADKWRCDCMARVPCSHIYAAMLARDSAAG